jgi:hypothetical protein
VSEADLVGSLRLDSRGVDFHIYVAILLAQLNGKSERNVRPTVSLIM